MEYECFGGTSFLLPLSHRPQVVWGSVLNEIGDEGSDALDGRNSGTQEKSYTVKTF